MLRMDLLAVVYLLFRQYIPLQVIHMFYPIFWSYSEHQRSITVQMVVVDWHLALSFQ